ncbi:MAG: hypothetical protein IPK82_06490 [Polyangiaceae bacterium]|nr:hypothetical protein [Polyangiaceae bacterium]
MRRFNSPMAGWVVPLIAIAALSPPTDAGAQSADPALRGLDLFVDVPRAAVNGQLVPIQIQAYGFPSATVLAALPGAAIEAVWDADSLGPGAASTPPPVKAVTDANGRVHIDVLMPDGNSNAPRLLIGTKFGEHRRTTEISVQRADLVHLSLVVPDRRVVPGGSTNAWVFVRDVASGKPASNRDVSIELLEGGVPRSSQKVTTDAAGTAVVRVPIPRSDEPLLSWQLMASASVHNDENATGSVILEPREETPGLPELSASWDSPRAFPGDSAGFVLSVRDASGRPVVGAPIRYWIGPKGTEPPSPSANPKGWERESKVMLTNSAGEARGRIDAPSTLKRGAALSLRLYAHATFYGRELTTEKMLEVIAGAPTVEALPEVGVLVPGMEQTVIVNVRDGRDKPVSGAFLVEGDNLNQKIQTDARGEAKVLWKAPRDVGAARNVGPCANGVAATISIKPIDMIAALDNRSEPFRTCVRVERTHDGIVRSEKGLLTAGSVINARIFEPDNAVSAFAKPTKKSAETWSPAWSITAEPLWPAGANPVSGWLVDTSTPLPLSMRSAAPGAWFLGALAPRTNGDAKVAPGRVIVAPAIVPKLKATLAGGRAAPLGTVEIDVDLTDGKGRGIPGSVAAVLVDAYGGGVMTGLMALDTRSDLCGRLRIEPDACDAFFDDDSADVLRARVLASLSVRDPSPTADPGATAKEDLRRAFKSVLMSLEGAVMDATREPDSLRDAFRKEKNAYTFNPELFSLVTAAMEPPPVTPGGEPISLADLLALDKQVTYDNVARRVTRLKLFRVLEAVRTYRRERALDPDEPALRDPNAILRRLVSTQTLSSQDLVDPWGGTMSFVKGTGQKLPFMTIKGFELHAPGPDNKLGTADDVKSPFERVVQSGTPYAEAMEEDRLVDSELDMEVSESSVENWRSTLEELTGQTLGSGYGSGYGRLGGSHGGGGGRVRMGATSVNRSSHGISPGAEFWLPPQRTDQNGHLRISVPLGDVETTWRLAIVGAPDGATPAVTSLDIPSALPLSARVESGSVWIEKDRADVMVTLRNRTAQAAKVNVSVSVSGVAELVNAKSATANIDVPAGGALPFTVGILASRPGNAGISVTAKSANGLEDHTTHTWEVRPAGEAVDLSSSQWVTGDQTLALSQISEHMRPTGLASLVLERGNRVALEAALASLDPDVAYSSEGLSYIQEAAARIRTWRMARVGQADVLSVRANDIVRRSIGRFVARRPDARSMRDWAGARRAVQWAPPDLVKLVNPSVDCPPAEVTDLDSQLALIESEPSSSDGVIEACWDSLATAVASQFSSSQDPVSLARAVLAFSERPQRTSMAATLAEKLRIWVDLQPSGRVTLPAHASAQRASRALVFAALLRSAKMGKPSVASPERLVAWLRVQADSQGGYGSSLATLAAVRAFLNGPMEPTESTKVLVKAPGLEKEVTVGPDERVHIPLGAKAVSVELSSRGPGLIARLYRPGIRLWSAPPNANSGPLAFSVEWPENARAGQKGVLRIFTASRTTQSFLADIRVPLPPGASLAEAIAGVKQIQGQLVVRSTVDSFGARTVQELPILFALAGKFTIPEARAKPATEEGARSVAASQPFVVR